MAFHHASIFFALIFLWLILASGNASPSRSQSLRSIRTIKQRAFKDMDLLVARGYGKRMPLSTARSYGKRAVNMDNVNNFLLEWLELESRMRNMGYPRSIRKEEDIIIPE
ncbi:uncharacterized protein LOC109600928 [Aethina tumida]|uniref:uncharacterized protein LOC109600928 n=1 Tax=Aethina tumida TaxID=116153 RepID=UPI00096B3349|nr:uncharacterized protein LOC109600928 [Aethina tumida]